MQWGVQVGENRGAELKRGCSFLPSSNRFGGVLGKGGLRGGTKCESGHSSGMFIHEKEQSLEFLVRGPVLPMGVSWESLFPPNV